MSTTVRRLGTPVFAVLLLVSFTGPAAAALPAFDLTTLAQAEAELDSRVNAERAAQGLVALQLDPDVMAIARRRAETMAATDTLSHRNPDGSDVFSAIVDAGVPWFGAGEVIGWNTWVDASESTARTVTAWMGSPPHSSILLSADFNYAGFGVAVSPTSGRRYYAGVMLKRLDRTGPWAKAGATSSQMLGDSTAEVTLRWIGGDTRLQVLTAGLRDYEVQRRVLGGAWRPLGTTTKTSLAERLPRGRTYEYRIRARDRAGNRGAWSLVTLTV